MANHGFWRWPEKIFISVNPEGARTKYRIYTHEGFAEASVTPKGLLYVMDMPTLAEVKRVL